MSFSNVKSMILLFSFSLVFEIDNGFSIAGDLADLCKKGDLKACEAGCEKGQPQLCLYLGIVYSKGREGKDKVDALSYFAKACEGDVVEGCVMAGVMIVQGDGVPQDIRTGMRLLKRGCLEGVGFACASLGEYFEMKVKVAEEKGLLSKSKIKDGYELVNKYFNMACKLGDKNSCARLEGGKSTVVCADLKSCKKACRKGLPKGCLILGKIYEKGEATQQSIALAVVSYEESCGRNVAEACFRLGKLYIISEEEKEHTKKRGIALIRKSCKLGFRAACEALSSAK